MKIGIQRQGGGGRENLSLANNWLNRKRRYFGPSLFEYCKNPKRLSHYCVNTELSRKTLDAEQQTQSGCTPL